MTCGSELTDFEGGAQDILNGLTSMVGSSPPSSNGWSDISSGFSEIENGLQLAYLRLYLLLFQQRLQRQSILVILARISVMSSSDFA